MASQKEGSSVKCAVEFCTRESQVNYHGTHRQGRAPAGSVGVPYCCAHYKQISRGQDFKPLQKKDVSKQRLGQYRKGIEDAATIAEFHGYTELSALLRKLN